jgi:transcriptional regulator with XRE-family HTH domain
MGKVRRVGPRNAAGRLAARLDELGLTQSELSERLGVSTSAVSRWLSGDRRPSLEKAFEIESDLGIPAELWLSPDAA